MTNGQIGRPTDRYLCLDVFWVVIFGNPLNVTLTFRNNLKMFENIIKIFARLALAKPNKLGIFNKFDLTFFEYHILSSIVATF